MALNTSLNKKIDVNNFIKFKFDLPDNTVLNNVYIKIINIQGSKEKLYLSVIGLLDNEIVYEKIFEFAPSVEINSDNFIKQGYEYLKTLDEFKDAIDC